MRIDCINYAKKEGYLYVEEKIINCLSNDNFGESIFELSWMGFYPSPWPSYGIHGTNMPNFISKSASHGCIRMYNQDVTELYSLVKVGTPVTIVP